MPERGLDHEELALLLGLFTVNPAPGGGAASAAAGGEVTQTTGGQVQGAPPQSALSSGGCITSSGQGVSERPLAQQLPEGDQVGPLQPQA